MTPLKPFQRSHWHRWNFRPDPHSCVKRFSTSGFFHQSTPPRALTHRIKPFRIWLHIRQNNQHYSSFSGVNDTAETGSTVSMTLPKPFQRCHWHRKNCFSGVNDTAEIRGKKFLWLKSLWYFSFHDHGRFSGLIDTAETVSVESLMPLKRFQWCHWHRCIGFSGVIDTAESVSAVSLTALKQLWGAGLKFQRCQCVIDTTETRIMSIISANTKPYAKRF
jgi:hypothetical protein